MPTGSCLCGKVKYHVTELSSTKMAHCHCSDCRKFHGAAFSTFGETKTLQWTAGQSTELSTFVAPNGSRRQFCSNCGSSLTFRSKDAPPGTIEFALSTLDHDEAGRETSDHQADPQIKGNEFILRPDAHVFVSSKVPWINIDGDGLDQHSRDRS